MLTIVTDRQTHRRIQDTETYKNIARGLGGPVVRPLAARAEGPRFDSPIAQHVQRLFFLAFTYGAVSSLVLSWYWTRQPGFISFR